MTGRKVKLAWIANDGSRKASLNKRRESLSKKLKELITLCGIDAFIITYAPDEPQPVVCSLRPTIKQLLMRFLSAPEIVQCKRITTLEDYLKERLAKVQDKLKRQQMENNEMVMNDYMRKLNQGNEISVFESFEINEFHRLVQAKLEKIRKQVEYVQHVSPFPSSSCLPQDHRIENMAPTEFGTIEDGRNPTNAMLFYDLMNNNGNIARSSNTKHDMGPPYTFNIRGGLVFGSEMGLHHGGIDGSGTSNALNLELSLGCIGGNNGGSSIGVTQSYGHTGETMTRLPYGKVTTGCSEEDEMTLSLLFDNIASNNGGDAKGGIPPQANAESSASGIDIRLP